MGAARARKLVACQLTFYFLLVTLVEGGWWCGERWSGWGPCSRSCGGGTQSRMETCDRRTESRGCNEFCYNGGQFYSGYCHCPTSRAGICCENYNGHYRPCSDGNGGCDHTCITETGVTRCACNSGYMLNSDTFTCSVYHKPCNDNNVGCSQRCVTELGVVRCECDVGYDMQPDKASCKDIDECALGKCDHSCTNTPGSFLCSCRTGYKLESDAMSCTETNIWNVFLAQLEVSAEHKHEWYDLVFRVQGRLVADTGSGNSFHDSYLDGLHKLLQNIADETNKRLSVAQNLLTRGQSGLSTAQQFLEDKKKDIWSANSKFDETVNVLEHVKNKLEAAKDPFQKAIRALNKAHRDLDSLCKTVTCNTFCIPGIKCRRCYWRTILGNIPYPCCQFTNCMIAFPDPLCAVANLACRAVRAVAYVALEAAKIFVRVPMLALDIAKAAVSVAQIVVDKSRIVLDIAVVAIDIAQVGLEGAKGVLEIAKVALEAVKLVVSAGIKVVNFVIKVGLQSIIDVKNCRFDISVGTTDLPGFEVSCDVNAFRLGWRTVRIGINFKNVLQSLWQAAKATVKVLLDVVGGALFGRKKREIFSEAMFLTHKIIRLSREAGLDIDNADIYLNETIDTVYLTPGFGNMTNVGDYDNRVDVFRTKCESFQNVFAFLNESIASLFEIANETTSMLDEVESIHAQLKDFDMDSIRNNFTMQTMGIDHEVAVRDYNLTSDDLQSVMEETQNSLSNDSLLKEIQSGTELAKNHIKTQAASAEQVQITDHWLIAMENVTNEYFDNDVCVSFMDCAHYAISVLYDLYQAETLPNMTESGLTVSVIEDGFIDLIGNSSQSVRSIYTITSRTTEQLNLLNDLNVFCSEAPALKSKLSNTTLIKGNNLELVCDMSGDPTPNFWWYKDDDVIEGQHGKVLAIDNVTEAGRHKCVAGNLVANLSSNYAHIMVTEDESGSNGGNSAGKNSVSSARTDERNQVIGRRC